MMIIKIMTAFRGKFVGCDAAGNHYYQERFLFSRPLRRPRRWVVYNGPTEASKVCPEWYGWLHYTVELPLDEAGRHSWQKPYTPNMTGTVGAYRPQPNPSQGYEAWKPN